MPDTPYVPKRLADAQKILAEASVIDTLGGPAVHPTPYVAQGTYEENMVAQGWNILHACLVSEPSDRKSTRLNSSHEFVSRMPSSA